MLLVAAGADAAHVEPAYPELREAAADLQQSEQLLSNPGSWSVTTIDSADSLRSQAQALLTSAKGRLGSDPGFAIAGAIPRLGDQTRAVSDLVDTGLDGVAADADLAAVARAYVLGGDPHAKLTSRLISLLTQTAAPLADADQHLRRAAARLQVDAHSSLVPQLAKQVTTALDTVAGQLPKVDAAATLAQLLPAAMGTSGPRTYLVALPNPAELRPSGGLSAFIGVVQFSNGLPTQLSVSRGDVYTPLRPCFPIPTVLAYYLKFQPNCQDLGDAGWDPDFPTTARLMESMVLATTGVHVDGVISLDPYAIADLLRVIGPISVPGYGAFTADNLLNRTEVIVNVQNDYGVMNPLARTLLAQILGAPVTKFPDLIGSLQTNTAERHIQLHMRDATLEQRILAGSAGGALEGAAGDYLMVVDANVSPSKGDLFMQKRCDVNVTVQPSGLAQHEVTASYTYPKPATPSRADTVLNTDGVYRDYVRFVVPGDATVADIEYVLDGKPAPAAAQPIVEELGKTVIGMYFELPRGHTGQVTVSYTDHVPGRGAYHLLVQKQAGASDRPTTLDVVFPGGRRELGSELTEDASFDVGW
ncbi:MAG TPA: DUF4012 domain-containing protein [Candidatus Dormibacteraeota bacterium]